MKTELVNGELELTLPEGFAVMSREEVQQAYKNSAEGSWGMADRERKINVFVIWQKPNPILAWLTDVKAMTKKNEKMTAEAYQDYGYKREDFFAKAFGRTLMQGYHFRYTLNGSERCVETLLFKKKGAIYNVTCVCGAEFVSERDGLMKEVFKTWTENS